MRYISKSAFLFAGLLAGLLPGISHAANLVTNGSFEDIQIKSPFVSSNPLDIPGWTHTGSTGDGLLWGVGYADCCGSVTVAGEGNQFVTAGGGFGPFGTATWSQTVSGLTIGDTYTLSFRLSGEANFSGNQSFDVGASGTSFVTQSFVAPVGPSNYWTGWTPYSVSFTANATATTLSFTAATAFDAGLDNVSLTAAAVPEPQTYALMLAGLGLVGFVARRRKSSLS